MGIKQQFRIQLYLYFAITNVIMTFARKAGNLKEIKKMCATKEKTHIKAFQ